MSLYVYMYVQESVSLWLSVLQLSQYEQTMLDAGYDDIDFVCDITLDDLHDIGIVKKGELRVHPVKCLYVGVFPRSREKVASGNWGID